MIRSKRKCVKCLLKLRIKILRFIFFLEVWWGVCVFFFEELGVSFGKEMSLEGGFNFREFCGFWALWLVLLKVVGYYV